MCIRCSSNQEYRFVSPIGYLCKRCYGEWTKKFNSCKESKTILVWGRLWREFMREESREKVIFT